MRSERGQLALGIAFAFTMVLAMFSLVFNSSLLSREKMKLQQTTDFATLVAADVQRHNLNQIRKHNESIKTAYEGLLAAIIANAIPCFEYNPGLGLVRAKALAAIFGGSALRSPSADPCDIGCSSFDGFVYGILLSIYASIHEYHLEEILNIMTNANSLAFDKALETYLLPGNLPMGLRNFLEERHGKRLEPLFVRKLYEQGLMQELYEIDDSNAGLPLFTPDVDMLTVLIPRHMYKWVFTMTKDVCVYSGLIPIPMPVGGKVYKAGDYVTSFVTGAAYSPITAQVLKELQLYTRQIDPNAPDFGKIQKDMRGKVMKLFAYEDGTQTRFPTSAVAAAKPYGGRFPRKSNLIPGNFGDNGSTFEGAKLIGIADKQALDGYRLNLDYEITQKGVDGFITETIRIFTEDYLH